MTVPPTYNNWYSISSDVPVHTRTPVSVRLHRLPPIFVLWQLRRPPAFFLQAFPSPQSSSHRRKSAIFYLLHTAPEILSICCRPHQRILPASTGDRGGGDMAGQKDRMYTFGLRIQYRTVYTALQAGIGCPSEQRYILGVRHGPERTGTDELPCFG